MGSSSQTFRRLLDRSISRVTRGVTAVSRSSTWASTWARHSRRSYAPGGDEVGWWAGFLLAAVGMVTAYSLFQFDGQRLRGFGEPPAGAPKSAAPFIYIGAICAIPLVWFLIHNTMISAEVAAQATEENKGVVAYLAGLPLLGKILLFVGFLATFWYSPLVVYGRYREEFERMLVAIVLIVFSVVFWTLFEQAGSSLTLFAERNTIATLVSGKCQRLRPRSSMRCLSCC